jgi:signal transduction histidine kinase
VVIVTLLALLIVPYAIDQRAKALREAVTVGEHARTAVNDFEASLATELLLRTPTGTTPGASHATEEKLDTDLADLHVALHEMDRAGLVHYDTLSSLLSAWRSAIREGDRSSSQKGLQLIESAETLDNYLTKFVDDRRARVQAMTRYYFLVPVILAPIAALAMALSMWNARRLQLFAGLAEAERAEVVRASESRAALLRGVTHDVKNPLGAANGYAQLLEEGIVGPLDDAQVKMIGRIRHLLGTSIQTVTDLVELARADGTLHLEYAMTDLAATMHEVVDDHRGMAQERQVTIEVNGKPVTVMTDPLRLRQILSNLITNAIKYTPSGANVWTRIVHDADRIGVAVEDNGPGIPREAEARLFEEFFRVRTGEDTSGNGLGLAISRRLGRLLGGDVTYARREGGGSIFTVWLPYHSMKSST